MEGQELSLLLRKVVTLSANGWDIVVSPLIQLSLQLIDTAKVQGMPVPVDMWEHMVVPADAGLPSTAALVVAAGMNILRKVFQRHRFVR